MRLACEICCACKIRLPRVRHGLEAGKDIHALLGDDFRDGRVAVFLDAWHSSGNRGATLIDIEQQVSTLAASGAAADALQATIDQQLSNLDTQLAIYDAAMADQVARLSEIARVVSVLDQLCAPLGPGCQWSLVATRRLLRWQPIRHHIGVEFHNGIHCMGHECGSGPAFRRHGLWLDPRQQEQA